MAAFRDLLLAHALRFERPERSPYDAAAGRRLLLAFVLVGLVIHPGLTALLRFFGLAGAPWAGPGIVVALLLAVVLLVRGIGLSGESIGLHRWSRWTPRERLYLASVAPIAIPAFAFVFREHLARLIEVHGWVGLLALSVPIGLLWGIVQELVYRGLLQTELTRRSGGGVLVTNLLFTFGPLHANYYGLGSESGPRWGMFAAIFAIGFFFGLLYRRSGNLWLPAILHGLWPLNMA
jgi:membrane protease YdiL (CAAX protease family)